jgi:hypothetical protein
MPYLTAPAICVLAMPVALIAHVAWGDDRVMIAVMAIGSTLLIGSIPILWKRRHEHTRNAAAVFGTFVLGWVVFATASNPVSPAMLKSWAMGTIFVSLLWGIRHAAMSPHHEDDKPGGSQDILGGKISSLKNSKVKATKETPGRVEAKIQMPQGEGTSADVQMDRVRIASAVGMGEEEVTVTGVPGRADQVTLAFQLTENMKKSVKWTGPSAPGRSIADAPLVPGRRANGEPLNMWIVGSNDPDEPRPLPHTLATGVNGSGKTETLKTLIVDMRWRTDVVPVVAGPDGKFQQDFGEVRKALGLEVVGVENVNQFIRNLPDAIAYRQQMFGELVRADGTTGYAQWEPEVFTLHGFPLLFVDIEEAADFLSRGDEEFDEAIRKARSAGIALCASMQTAHHSNIERKTRGQFTNSLCHGCVEAYDARFSLSSGTLERGADPTKWRNNYPGSLYGELVGTDPESWAEEARAFYLSRAQKIAELDASQAAGHWAQIDEGTLRYLSRGLTSSDGGPVASAPAEPEDDNSQVSDLTRIIDTEGTEVDVTVPIGRPQHDVVFALRPPEDEAPKLTVEQARELVESKIDELETRGQMEINFSDLAELPGLTGRSRPWVYAELKRLVDGGRLTQVDGKLPYYIKARISNGHRP